MGNRQCKKGIDRLDKAGKLRDLKRQQKKNKKRRPSKSNVEQEKSSEVKLLLIGQSKAGKSTLMRQARLFFHPSSETEFAASTRNSYKVALREQIVSQLSQLDDTSPLANQQDLGSTSFNLMFSVDLSLRP